MSTKRAGEFLSDIDLRREKFRNRVFHGLLVAASLFGLVMLVLLIADVIWQSAQALLNYDIDLWNFLTATSSSRAGQAGFGASIIASLWLMVLTAGMAFVIAVGCALYLVEYAPENRTTRLIEANLANLAGVPSIVYGLLVLALIVNDAGMGRSSSPVPSRSRCSSFRSSSSPQSNQSARYPKVSATAPTPWAQRSGKPFAKSCSRRRCPAS